MTDWKELEGGPSLGVGLHTFLRDDDADHPAGVATKLRIVQDRRATLGVTAVGMRTPGGRAPRIDYGRAIASPSKDGINPGLDPRPAHRPRIRGDELAARLQRRTDDRFGPARPRGPAQHAPDRITRSPPSSSRSDNSIVAYGLPDLVSYHVRGTEVQRAIASGHRGGHRPVRAAAPNVRAEGPRARAGERS